jgi:hypothetical protein
LNGINTRQPERAIELDFLIDPPKGDELDRTHLLGESRVFNEAAAVASELADQLLRAGLFVRESLGL